MSDAGKILEMREIWLKYPAGQADIDDAAILDRVAEALFVRAMFDDKALRHLQANEEVVAHAFEYAAIYVTERRALIDAARKGTP